MRRKVLQDVANTLCQMVVGWRMGCDYEQMAELADGTLSFDLLGNTVRHSSGIGPDFWITGELASWLNARLKAENIDILKVVSAKLEVQYRTDRIITNRKKIISFDFDCRSELQTDEATYRGLLVERHVWHQRTG